MRHRVWKFFFLLLPWLGGRAWANPSPAFLTPNPATLAEIQAAFPEGLEVAPRLLDYRVDPNLHLFQEAEIEITYLGEGAGYHNSFGYFLYQDLNEDGSLDPSELLQREILWEDISDVSEGGEMKAGDTFRLGKFPAGTRMGFFLIADAFRGGTETYFTIDSWNPDGHRHLAMLATSDREQIILGIEDLPWDRSDRDFNDILFSVGVSPRSALQAAIEAGNIPVHDGETAPPDSAAVRESPRQAPPAPIAQSLAPPALLEGGGLGCQLNAGSDPAPRAASPLWVVHFLGLTVLYRKWRDWKGRP